VVGCDADLSKSTMMTYFAKEFPTRFFECGIAEANMVRWEPGLAMTGKIPFVSSFSCFVMNKGFEQLRTTVAYPRVNVKVVGTHSGISIGEDGPSQMSIEGPGAACALPGFTVISPADEVGDAGHGAVGGQSTLAACSSAADGAKVPVIYCSRLRRLRIGKGPKKKTCCWAAGPAGNRPTLLGWPAGV